MLGIVTLIIIWYTHTRMDEHQTYHRTSGQNATQKTANEISHSIKETKRLLDFFASQHINELWKQAHNQSDQASYQQTLKKLKKVFPGFITFTVINNSGTSSYSDPNHLKTPDCIADLQTFLKKNQQQIRIHPAEPHHYSLISPFQNQHYSGFLIGSFSTEALAHTLLQSEITGHQLFITLPAHNNLIEVAPTGSRDSWERESYLLSADEKERIIASSPIDGTDWQVIDVLSERLFSDYIYRIIFQSNIIIVMLVIASLVIISLNRGEVKRRQKAEAVKDEFLSIVSHELRTPLTAISGALTLLESATHNKLAEGNQSLLNIALNNSQRLTTLVNDLLDVQKIESGHMSYSRKLTQPASFVEAAAQAVIKSKIEKHYKIDIKNDLDKELVFVDPDRMVQVVTNLLSNAIKYGTNSASDEEEIINVHLYLDGQSVFISVTDYGEGIKEENRNLIFEKFRQANMTDQRHSGGSGLGLYISKSIVNYHGGKIRYISTPGTGTTFYIQLPVITITHK